MKLVLATLIALSLTACTALTGDPVADCLTARNASLTAQQVASATAALASANPSNTNLGAAARLAADHLATSLALQASICPIPL